MKNPKRINLNLDQVDNLLKRVKNGSLQEGDYEIIKAMAETIYLLSQVVDEKATSIRRLLKMLFGAGTEKLENVVKNKSKTQSSEPSSENTDDDHSAKDNKNKSDQKLKGHGRNSAADYTGAEKVDVLHSKLKSGDNCPACLKGKLYELSVPGVIVRITGKPPLHATVYQLQRLRCNLCGEVFKADAPERIGEDKYDEASGAMIALLKYGAGMPFNRMEQLQAGLGIPLPASTQWDIVEQAGDRIYPVYEELIRQAAQGDIIYNDDTTMKILTLMQQNNAIDDHDRSERKGIFTTGIMSTLNDRKIALFFTGRKHAGENINDLLKKRRTDRDPPIQMCDALSQNTPKEFKTILANCLTHGRRKFVDVAWNFPDECSYVIETLAKVYKK